MIKKTACDKTVEMEKGNMEGMLKNHSAPDKESDPLGWVRHMNNMEAMAEEFVLRELVYV